MPERTDMTPDPLTDRLGRFTPQADGLDRTALLFEAGRASVRGQQLWPALVGVLAITQVVTLSVLLSRPNEPQAITPSVSRPAESAAPAIIPVSPVSPEREGRIASAWRPGSDLETAPAVKIVEHLVATAPPLSVHGFDLVPFRFE